MKKYDMRKYVLIEYTMEDENGKVEKIFGKRKYVKEICKKCPDFGACGIILGKEPCSNLFFEYVNTYPTDFIYESEISG